jgi:hypothetical protein
MAAYLKIENGKVANRIEVADPADFPDWTLVADVPGVQIGYSYDGATFAPPGMSPEALQAEVIRLVQERLDDFAKTRGYDDIKSACGYAGCSVSSFATEGAYCRDARAETWAALYALLDLVQAGNWPTTGAAQAPTSYEDIEPQLPALSWPS